MTIFDDEMVRSISDLSHVMPLETIAEFVGNAEIFDKLKHIGVGYVQGNHLGKPEPINSLLNQTPIET